MKRKILSILIAFMFVFASCYIKKEDVNAANNYSAYVPNGSEDAAALDGKEVVFNGTSWYIIEDNSTATNAGTVTLLAWSKIGDDCLWDSDYRESYSGSTVETRLMDLTSTGSFKSVSSAIVGTDLADVGVKGAKLWLLSEEEAKALPSSIRGSDWWTRTTSVDNTRFARVMNSDGTTSGVGKGAWTKHVRPACKLDLSKVAFYTNPKNNKKTFVLKPEEVKAVETQISALKSVDKITTADKDAIEAARKAYDSLTDEQKAMVDATIYKKLTDAEDALKNADKKDDKKDDKKSDQKGSSNNSKSTGGNSSSTGSKSSKYKNEWFDGKWYNADGSQTYKGTMKWKNNSKGWWIEDSAGWYPQNQWQKIDGKYYYFDESGYMAADEWRDGCWLGSDGAWDDTYKMTWKSDSKGWWIEDKTGWYPQNQWQKIDGNWYYFKGDGYMATSQYINGWWVDSNGVCQ